MKRNLMKEKLLMAVAIFYFAMLLIPNFFSSPIKRIYAAQSLSDKQQAIVTMAEYYYMRGEDIQYDQKSLDVSNSSAAGSTTGRRELNIAPEIATSQHTVYMDCSSFCYNIFRVGFNYAFNNLFSGTTTKALIDWAQNNASNLVTVMYHENSAGDNATSILNTFKSNLQVGDMVVYRRGNPESGGHVMMYIGNEQFLHSTGVSYNYSTGAENWEQTGTVQRMPLEALVSPTYYEPQEEDGGDSENSTPITSTRYLFGSDKTRFAILRMLNYSSLPNYTTETQARIDNGLLYIEKTSSADPKHTVYRGQNISYTIKLVNNNSYALNNVSVSGAIPSNTTFVSASSGGVYSGGLLSYSLNLAKDQEVTLQYTVKVNTSSGSVGSENISVNGIKAGKITHSVGTPLSAAQQYIFSSTAKAYAAQLTATNYQASSTGTSWQTTSSTLKGMNSTQKNAFKIGTNGFIRAIYNEAFDLDINYSDLSVPFTSLADSNRVNYSSSDASSFSGQKLNYYKMQVPNLFGGNQLTTYDNVNARMARTRYVGANFLMAGDIITQQMNSTNEAFLAIDGSNGIELLSFRSSGIKYYKDAELDSLLNKLLMQDKFVVLRPSLAYNANTIAVAPELVVQSKTHNSITIKPVDGAEYSSNNGSSWQDSNVLSGLIQNTNYQVTMRMKAVENLHSASVKAQAQTVKTSTAGASVEITTNSLTGGTFNAPYNATIAANGTGPITFTSVAGTLPNGLTLSINGILSGTPTRAGSFTFTVQAEIAAQGVSAQRQFTVVVARVNGTGSVSMDGWVYGAQAASPTLNGVPSELGTPTYEYQINQMGAFVAAMPTNAGTHNVRAKFNATANYNAFTTEAAAFTIAKADGSGSLSVNDWTYGTTSSRHNLTGISAEYGEPIYEYKQRNANDSTYTNQKPTAVGDYTVRARFEATQNYNEYVITANFSITAADSDGGLPLEIIAIAGGALLLTTVSIVVIFIIKKRKA